jgi:hypothetical protein
MNLSGNENFSVFRPSTGQINEINPATLSVAGLTFTPDLTTSTISTGSGAVGPTTFDADLKESDFDATLDTLHLLGDNTMANQNIATAILPTPVLGASIKFVVMEDITNGKQWNLFTDDQVAIGSYFQVSSLAGKAPKGKVITNGNMTNWISIVGTTDGGGGKGGTVNFYGVQEGDDVRWLMSGSLCTQGTGTMADTSNFGG